MSSACAAVASCKPVAKPNSHTVISTGPGDLQPSDRSPPTILKLSKLFFQSLNTPSCDRDSSLELRPDCCQLTATHFNCRAFGCSLSLHFALSRSNPATDGLRLRRSAAATELLRSAFSAAWIQRPIRTAGVCWWKRTWLRRVQFEPSRSARSTEEQPLHNPRRQERLRSQRIRLGQSIWRKRVCSASATSTLASSTRLRPEWACESPQPSKSLRRRSTCAPCPAKRSSAASTAIS